jgi:hypothetical protein
VSSGPEAAGTNPTMRFTVDPWDPSYGASVEGTLVATTIEVNVEVEQPTAAWAPRPAGAADPFDRVAFVDGVRRVEARGWIEAGSTPQPALFASFAAGAVCCDGRAEVVELDVRRGVFSASPDVTDVPTAAGRFTAGLATDPSPERLSIALQDAMTACEVATAERLRGATGAQAVIVDGPLRGRQHLADTVGFVKTHHVSYLPPALDPVVGALGPGERTPLFLLRSSWSRLAWYLRLPGPDGGPWAGIVRCEVPHELAPAAAVALADRVSATLPRFASQPHKDARAPQNLVPIAGLERRLRHRLGDPAVVYRALRRASRVA